jgi:hypothetical protein
MRDDRQWNTVRTLRWVIVGFGLVAGLVLLTVGATLFGVILVVMATLRIAMLVSMQRRMRSFSPGGTGRGGFGGRAGRNGAAEGRPGGRGELMLRLARNELDVAATAIGIAPDELRRAVDEGKTISAVAADAGIPSRQVVDAVVRDASAKVDRAVAAGNVAPNRARMLRNRLPQWAERFVTSTPAMLAGAPPRA